LPPSRYTILPNTAGCYSSEDAVRTLRLASVLGSPMTFVKLKCWRSEHAREAQGAHGVSEL